MAPTDEPEPTVAVVDTDTVDVDLGEWSVLTEPEAVRSGEITFEITNGGSHPHEFAVFRTDLDPAELPTLDDGSVDEQGEGLELVGEVEGIADGESAELTVDLEPASYVLVCNLVEEEGEGHEGHEGGGEVHYELGMRTAFTVS